MTEKNSPFGQMKIIYVMDPYCSWCYGGSPNILKLYNTYHEVVDFELLPAGMLRGEYEVHYTPEMERATLRSMEKVQHDTGREMGEGYLRALGEEDALWNSDASCRAIEAVKRIAPNKAFAFADALLAARFHKGLLLDNPTLFAEIGETIGINPEEFLREYLKEEVKQAAEESYNRVNDYAEVYPTLMLINGTDRYKLEEGYAPYELLEERLLKILTGKPIAAEDTEEDEEDEAPRHGCHDGVCYL